MLDPKARANPYPYYDWLRKEETRRVYKLEDEKVFYVVHKHEDVKSALSNHKDFVNKILPTKKSPFFALMDGANHKRIRGIVAQMLSIKGSGFPAKQIEEKLNGIADYRRYNAGFKEVKVLEGNVGYRDLRGFAPHFYGKDFADAYLKLIGQCDAVIIDLSKNGGGDPEMVQYLCSYFIEGGVHLNDFYFRDGDRTIEFWTLDKVDGTKMTDVPLFVMTGEKTFSGAEEFSYNMQTQKRATLVGQTTGGGANPGREMRINEELLVFIPRGMAINPITKTNWEGIGVIPEVKTDVSETLDKTLELAQNAAKDYKLKKREENNALLIELNTALENYSEGSSEDAISKELIKCIEANLLSEADINMMGYFYLIDAQNPILAKVVFKKNTELFPDSPNVYDSYAEAMMMKGDFEASQKLYQKAVNTAKKNNDPNLEFYQNNLNALKEKMNN